MSALTRESRLKTSVRVAIPVYQISTHRKLDLKVEMQSFSGIEMDGRKNPVKSRS